MSTLAKVIYLGISVPRAVVTHRLVYGIYVLFGRRFSTLDKYLVGTETELR